MALQIGGVTVVDNSRNATLNSCALNGNSSSLGYTTGAGGTVTQTTNKSTTVTLNRPSGQITMHNEALAAGASVFFTLNNSLLSNGDVVTACPMWATQTDSYVIQVTHVASGSARVRVTNVSAGSRSEAIVISFVVIKGATA